MLKIQKLCDNLPHCEMDYGWTVCIKDGVIHVIGRTGMYCAMRLSGETIRSFPVLSTDGLFIVSVGEDSITFGYIQDNRCFLKITMSFNGDTVRSEEINFPIDLHPLPRGIRIDGTLMYVHRPTSNTAMLFSMETGTKVKEFTWNISYKYESILRSEEGINIVLSPKDEGNYWIFSDAGDASIDRKDHQSFSGTVLSLKDGGNCNVFSDTGTIDHPVEIQTSDTSIDGRDYQGFSDTGDASIDGIMDQPVEIQTSDTSIDERNYRSFSDTGIKYYPDEVYEFAMLKGKLFMMNNDVIGSQSKLNQKIGIERLYWPTVIDGNYVIATMLEEKECDQLFMISYDQ